ncbi:fatty acyl-CoA reductase wat-like [Planococcus citri]|uniref:fatty acyl-CoA reductase wat-like n=1 Tax=Planococcus citri TaxID=170843 RepID=UPI0031F8D691
MDVFDKRDDSYDELIVDTVVEKFCGKTEIQNFYTDKTILITGGSGFLGLLLIEKLLRSCSDLKKVILIVREKRGKSVRTRIKEIFNDEIFEKMKIQNPNYWKKVQIITGCCEAPMMGMGEDQVKKLQSEVNIVFHSAATVRFDEHIRNAYETNVSGTKYLLEIAKGMRNLKAFVYVSTAYAQSHLPHIEEKIYPGALTDEEMSILLKGLDDKTLGCLTPIILNGRFNTYTMTKGIAEEVVAKHRHELPVAIFRPSIVTATVSDPLTCWTNNIYGATGVFVGSGVGFLRTLYCDPDCKAEIVPADRVVSGLIAVPLHIQKNYYNASQDTSRSLVKDPVYNFVANQSNVLTWGSLQEVMIGLAKERSLATDTMIWTFHLSLDKHYTLWLIKYFLFHLFPAPFFMLMELIMKQKPRIWNGYIKLYKYTQLYSFFMVRSWQIGETNTKDLYNSMTREDKLLFNCKTEIDWDYYFFYMTKGLGNYIVKFNWNNSHKVQTRAKILGIIDRALIWSARGLMFLLGFKLILAVINYFLVV